VPTATGDYVLAVIRDATEAPQREDLADLARSAVAEQPDRMQELLDRVVRHLSRVGLSLQDAADLPSEVAHERITEALARLDDTIREIRDRVYASRDEEPPSEPGPPGAT
jgi:hypothetical protein